MLFIRIVAQLCRYNLFMREEDDYDDDDAGERNEPTRALQQQRYTTWLYLVLLLSKWNTPRMLRICS